MQRPQSVERAIEEIALRQFGVFARSQALELGATRHVIGHRVASGEWPEVTPAQLRAPSRFLAAVALVLAA